MSDDVPDVTYMPTEQFDEMVRTLDEPDDCSRLMAALERSRGTT